MNVPAPAGFNLDTKRLLQAYSDAKYDALSEELLSILSYFERALYFNGVSVPHSLTPFLKIFFYLFTQPDYIVSDRHIPLFIQQNTLLSNMTAMSPFRDTDAFIEILREQPSNFVKILTLYSARNTVVFDRSVFFSSNAYLASLWYNQYCELYKSGLVRADIVERMAKHLAFRDERLLPATGMAEAYYGCTYVDGERDREFKTFLNQSIGRHYAYQPSQRAPDPRKIAIISDFWYPTHSVYRNYAAYVEALKPHYHLTLFHILMPREKLDTSMFDETHHLNMADGRVPPALAEGQFQMVYFPDIGMTDPSILLSNCRIAPIQICSPGHSVSTWGSEIDYFISGADVEASDPEHHYSERLVLLPGMGVIHNRPHYELRGIVKKRPELIINCPWSGQKMCARFLSTIRCLLDRVETPVLLRIFPNSGIAQKNAFLPFVHDIRAALGEKAELEVHYALPYSDYMALMEEGDITLDSFHFAGCNSVADSLFLRKPTLVWEGDKWYNRIGPAMLRLIGLDNCISVDEDSYIENALSLIHDEKRRAILRTKLEKTDLDATIFSTTHAPSFLRAVNHLMANHAMLQAEHTKVPIVIEAT